MKGYKPDGSDFNFVSGGFKCAVGINNDTDDVWNIYMVKQKAAGGATESFQDWELVHAWDYAQEKIVSEYKGDFVAMFNAFGKQAAPKLKTMTGGSLPPIPADVVGKLFWHVRYKLSFRPDTFEVFHLG
jgi:hypothetical protein